MAFNNKVNAVLLGITFDVFVDSIRNGNSNKGGKLLLLLV